MYFYFLESSKVIYFDNTENRFNIGWGTTKLEQSVGGLLFGAMLCCNERV